MTDKENLESILTEYRCISDAPTSVSAMFENHRMAYDEKQIGYVFGLEREVKYKSTLRAGSDFNVYLIQNPFSWKEIERNGRIVKVRKAPELQGKLSELMVKSSLSGRKKKNAIFNDY